MELTLKPSERDYLEATLEAALGELREEIHHADSHSFKDTLKAELEMLRGLLEKIRVAEGATAGSR